MIDERDEEEDTTDIPLAPPVAAEGNPYDAASDFAVDTEMQISEASHALQEMPEIQPGNWDALPPEERLNALQTVENTLAGIQQRPCFEVQSEPMDAGVFGYFDGNGIVLNANHLEGNMPVEELVDTVVHEGRHAFQQYAVEHPGTVPDANVVDAWIANRAPGGYLSAEEYGQEIYQSQPVEADAWSYAGRVRGLEYGN